MSINVQAALQLLAHVPLVLRYTNNNIVFMTIAGDMKIKLPAAVCLAAYRIIKPGCSYLAHSCADIVDRPSWINHNYHVASTGFEALVITNVAHNSIL